MNSSKPPLSTSAVQSERNGARAVDDGGERTPPETYMIMEAAEAGLTDFEIIGTTADQSVSARWDGRVLVISSDIAWIILLSLPMSMEGEALHCLADPETSALLLIESLDYLDRIQYSAWCDLHAHKRTWAIECGRLRHEDG
jgi:hypothetical protein